MKRYILTLLLAVAAVSCSDKALDNSAGRSQVSLTVSLQEASVGKITLYGADEMFLSAKAWKWNKGDKVVATYVFDSTEVVTEPTEMTIDAGNDGLCHFIFKDIPDGAVFTKLTYGDVSAFGRTIFAAGGTIPPSLVYATADVSIPMDEHNIPGVTMKHRCSYFKLFADKVTVGGKSYTPSDIKVTGHGLLGGDSDDEMSFSLWDADRGAFTAKWLSLSNEATYLTFFACTSAGTVKIAEFFNAGGGNCRIFEVKPQKETTLYE